MAFEFNSDIETWFTHGDTQNSLYVAHNSFNYVFL